MKITKIFMCYYLFFTGHMEYARLILISSSVGDFCQSWLFHVIKFTLSKIYIFDDICKIR